MRVANFDDETLKVLGKVLFDVVILGGCWFVIEFLFHIESFKRGFFCDDESLKHPYHESTVGLSLLTVGIGLPLTIIVVVELLRWKFAGDDRRSMKLFGRDIPNWAVNIYKYVGLLLFGSGLTTIMTDVGKHVIGRFRPHFMTVCQPIMPDGTNCSHPLNKDRYILDYRCSNANASEYRIRDAAKSFPSGHSSLAMYSMLFAALYIHRRVTWDGPKTLKPILEFTLIAMAWATALSRVSDYKHHWSDVLAGSLLGVSVCLVIVFGFSDLFRKKPQRTGAQMAKQSQSLDNIVQQA